MRAHEPYKERAQDDALVVKLDGLAMQSSPRWSGDQPTPRRKRSSTPAALTSTTPIPSSARPRRFEAFAEAVLFDRSTAKGLT